MMLDETTTLKNKKQINILLSYWFDCKSQVVTKYFVSFFIEHDPADFIFDKFSECHYEKVYDQPWKIIFHQMDQILI